MSLGIKYAELHAKLSHRFMKSFIISHKKSVIIQIVLIIIVLAIYFITPKQYTSSVTIHPVFNTTVINSNNTASLSKSYTSVAGINLYFRELANAETRSEIYNEFLMTNDLDCELNFIAQPSIQFYEKVDRSFPVSGEFTNIQVKSYCKDIPQKFLTFLTNRINEKVIGKIQKTENDFLEYQRNMLILENQNDLENLENFFSARRDLLQRIIPSLDNDEENFLDSNQLLSLPFQSYNFDASFNLSMVIPLSRSAAEAELEFILSMSDLKKSSIGMINRSSLIAQYEIKHDFSGSKLVNISAPENIAVSKRNLFLAALSIFAILALGFVIIILTAYNKHKKLQ